MARGALLSLVYLAFFVFGAGTPFVLTLGYVWVDGANPQFLSYGVGLLPKLPVSMIMGAAALAWYFASDRRDAPRFTVVTGMTVLLALWCTITTLIVAEVPVAAWDKWNVAFKTVLFSAFIPYVIRSRVQIEAFLQVFLFSSAVFFLPAGLKTFVNGGGYGADIAIIRGNYGLTEGATLATVALMFIPIMFFLNEHALLVANKQFRRLGYIGLAVIAVAAAVGTYERTALVGMAVVASMLVLRSRNKFFVGLFVIVAALGVIYLSSSAWTQRIGTINDYSHEGSAEGRLLVWRWTLDYVAHHPLGGGFNVYLINHIVFDDGAEAVGKAFHSIYFEVLGEQGIIGFALFAGILVCTHLQLRRVIVSTRRNPDMQWAHDLGKALQTALLTIMACGAFIGIAFQPFIYYLVAMSTSLAANARKAERLRAGESTAGWRRSNLALGAPAPAPEPARAASTIENHAVPSWRDRAAQVTHRAKPG